MEITKDIFNETITKNKFALIDFWAEWCGPCQLISPIIEELSQELEDVTVGKVNIESEPELTSEFSVRSIPTILLFKDGKPVDKVVGSTTKQNLINLIEKHKS